MKRQDGQSVLAARFGKPDIYVALDCFERELKRGEIIFGPGKASSDLYLVLTGSLAECVIEESGAEDVVRIVRPGGVSGIECVFAPRGAHRRRKVVALEATTVVAIPIARLANLIVKGKDESLFTVVQRLQAELADDLMLRGRLLRGNNGTERISEFLRIFGWSGKPPVTWKVVANYLGMNGCAFSRSLSRLRK